ncbi:MAG: secretin N-terminal domain-containing protein [Planctomycetota bacterium]|jgi:type IV pilus assembly protein PilQ
MKSFNRMFNRSRFVVLCAIVLLCSVTTLATGASARPNPAGTDEILTPLEQRMQRMINVDANDVPIAAVMKQLADQADVDLIMSPEVTGFVTVSLTDVPLGEALQSILDVHGAAYVPGESVIRILPTGQMPEIRERLVTETFQIVHEDVAKVAEALEKFKSPKGSVSYVEGTSYIIVTDTESKIRDIGNLLRQIDSPTPQVLVEVRIYDITSKDNLDLGIEWSAGRRTNRDPITGAAIEDDMVVDEGGYDRYVESTTDPSLTAAFGGASNKTAANTVGLLRAGLLNEHIEVEALLRAEKEDINAKLLANPRILVVDNKQAVFDIVTENPYIERTITSAGITETVKFKEVGVKLMVTPHITTKGALRMHIQPEFGIVIGRVQLSSSDVPIVDTRKFDTTAVVRDGETVVLGGLRKKDTTLQINKIPILGDLPVLGNLFKFEGETTAVNELVIFITPRIMTELGMTESEQNAFDVTDFDGPTPVQTKAEKKIFEDN